MVDQKYREELRTAKLEIIKTKYERLKELFRNRGSPRFQSVP